MSFRSPRRLPRLALILALALSVILPPSAETRGLTAIPFDLPLESFNGTTAPAGWNVVTTSGVTPWIFNNPGNEANITGGNGNFAVAGGFDQTNTTLDSELRTPALNFSGAAKVLLSFRAALPRLGTGPDPVADADVSANGGTSWTNVWKGEIGVLVGLVTIDVSQHLANQANALVRFRYSNSVSSGQFYLDDVQILSRPPAAPAGLTLSAALNQNTVDLSWTGPGGEGGFKIERSPDGTTGWTAITTAGPGAARAADYAAPCGTRLHYRVRAFNAIGDSDPSAAANVQTKPCETPVVEINQGIGQHQGRLVGGRDTAIIVYLANPVAIGGQTVVVKRAGTPLTTLNPQPAAGPVSTLVFTCPTRAVCGEWQAGSYSFDVSLGDAPITLANVTFLDRAPIRVLAVPVKTSYGGTVKSVTGEDWKNAGEFTRRIYPVNAANFRWSTGGELDGSAADVTTEQGRGQLGNLVQGLQPANCAQDKNAANCFDKIMGFIPETIPVPGSETARIGGYAAGDLVQIVGLSPSAPRTVAHEVGHSYGLGDEYNISGAFYRCDVNPPPPTYQAGNWYQRGQQNFSCTESTSLPFEESGTGSRIIASQVHPFEMSGRGVINSDMGSFMGNFTEPDKSWISPQAWRQIFDSTAPPAPPQAVRLATTPYRAIEVSGLIHRNGTVTLDPFHVFTATGPLEPVSSTYRIQALGSLSQTLISQGLELEFEGLDGEGGQIAPFLGTLPFPAGTTAFRVVSGTTTLRVIPVSATAPSVAIITPTTGSTLTSEVTISWTSNDGDGGSLFYDVEYSPNGAADSWIVIASGLTDPSLTVDFADLPGAGSGARIKVIASDGVNSSEAIAGPFTVPGKAPEVFIDGPDPGARFRFGSPVTLDGLAFDDLDDTIASSSSLVWTSNRVSGTLGTGSLIVVSNLPIGQHIITLTARNSLSLTAIATTTITIEPIRVYVPGAQR